MGDYQRGKGEAQFSPVTVTSGQSFPWLGLSFPICVMDSEGDRKGLDRPSGSWAAVGVSVSWEQMAKFDGDVNVRNVPVQITKIGVASRTESPMFCWL